MPGTVPAGRVTEDLVDFSDMMPTMAAMTGAPLPTDDVLDGVSFAPQLRGRQGGSEARAKLQAVLDSMPSEGLIDLPSRDGSDGGQNLVVTRASAAAPGEEVISCDCFRN